MDSKYLKFEIVTPKKPRKTKIWTITNKYDGSELGHIEWFTKWKKYTFQPCEGTIFEETCLQDIASFCIEQTQNYKTGLVI